MVQQLNLHFSWAKQLLGVFLETNTGIEEWNYGTEAASQFNFKPPLQTPPYTHHQIIANIREVFVDAQIIAKNI